MHKIGETGRVNLEGKIWEVELIPHHQGKSYNECERDCPEGWEVATYFVLQSIRNDLQKRKQFCLENTYEFVQNPDTISRNNGYDATFNVGSDGAILDCDWDAGGGNPRPKVRYCREIPQPNQK